MTVDDVLVEPLPLLGLSQPVGVHSTLSDDRGRPDRRGAAQGAPRGRRRGHVGLLLFPRTRPRTSCSPRAAVEKECVATAPMRPPASATPPLGRTPTACGRDRQRGRRADDARSTRRHPAEARVADDDRYRETGGARENRMVRRMSPTSARPSSTARAARRAPGELARARCGGARRLPARSLISAVKP